MARLFRFFFPFLTHICHGRRCGVQRLPNHDFWHCPIATAPDILCGCGQHTCGKCSAACPVCGKKGHAADTLRQQLYLGIVPKWACPEHKMEDLNFPKDHTQRRSAARPTRWTSSTSRQQRKGIRNFISTQRARYSSLRVKNARSITLRVSQFLERTRPTVTADTCTPTPTSCTK